MNYYKLYHFTGALNSGSWVEINNPIFPLSIGNYLDERLDETYVTFYSKVENYKTTEIFKVEEYQKDTLKDTLKDTIYYIVGDDDATETPNGSGIYKHTLFLLEPTKLTEGILCPSLTFTNDLGQVYTNSQRPVTISRPEDFNKITFGNFETYVQTHPIQNYVIGQDSAPLTSLEMCEKYADWVKETWKLSKVNSGYDSARNNYSSLELRYNYNAKDIVDVEKYEQIDTSTVRPTKTKTPSDFLGLVEARYTLWWNTGQADYEVRFNYFYLVAANKYPLKPYTITSMTQRVLELAEPLSYYRTIPTFNFDGIKYGKQGAFSGWETTSGTDAEKYDKIRADEITITQATLREQLRAVAGLVHCEPRVKVIEEPVDLEEPGDLLGTALKFNIIYEPYDKEEEAEALNDKPYSFKRLNCSINEYCTEVRSNAHNLVNAIGYGKGVLVDPNNNQPGEANAGYLAMRPNVVNERVTESNGKASTSLPIYKIIKVVCGIRGFGYESGTNESQGYYVPPTDITPYVVEKAEYDLKSSYLAEYPRGKNYSIYYTQGSKGIDGLFFRADTTSSLVRPYSQYAIANILSEASGQSLFDVSDKLALIPLGLFFQITYIPIYSALLSHGKQKYNATESPFGQIYNQSENLIEAHYYGENVKGAAARLGNVEQERTYILDSVDDIPKAGQTLKECTITEEGQTIDVYTIAATNTEILPLYIKCTLALSKDFNRINPYVGISSNKRVYEVSEREAYDRSILLKSNVVITKSSDLKMSCPYASTTAHFVGALNGITEAPISVVYSSTINKNNTPNKKTVLPVVASAFGNAILFTWYYKDNYSAGEQLTYVNKGEADKAINGFWANDVPYCDYYGRAFGYYFKLLRYAVPGINTLYSYPENQLGEVNNDVLISGDILIRKDSREKLSFNLEFEFKTTEDDIIIGSGAASCCHLVDSTPSVASLCLFKGKFGKLQQTTIGMEVVGTIDVGSSGYSVTTDTSVTSVTYGRSMITFPTVSSTVDYDSWAICFPTREDERTYTDEDGTTTVFGQKIGGEIFIAGNGALPNVPLYIVLRR